MIKLDELVDFLERELRTSEIPDYPGAHNGLQLQNEVGTVTRVACAVDASFPVIRKALAAGADLLVVHHGLFWQGVRPLTGVAFQKLRETMQGGLAIYSSHLPLDIHPRLGNNIGLAKALGLGEGESFFDWKGIHLGRKTACPGTLGELVDQLEKAVQGPVIVRGDRQEAAGQVGVITGGAGSEVEKVARLGIDTFITGEGPHWSHPLAEELGLKVCYGGHYATETFGVKALGQLLEKKFGLPSDFIDHPTQL